MSKNSQIRLNHRLSMWVLPTSRNAEVVCGLPQNPLNTSSPQIRNVIFSIPLKIISIQGDTGPLRAKLQNTGSPLLTVFQITRYNFALSFLSLVLKNFSKNMVFFLIHNLKCVCSYISHDIRPDQLEHTLLRFSMEKAFVRQSVSQLSLRLSTNAHKSKVF